VDAYATVDLSKDTDLAKLDDLADPTHVIHLAGLLPPKDEIEFWRVNVCGTLKFLESIGRRKEAAVRFLNVGSAAEYGYSSDRPIKETDKSGGVSAYGRSKWAQSTLALEFGKQNGIEVMVARTFNLIGPGTPESLVPGALAAQFAKPNGAVRVGDLAPRRDFIDIRDAVAGYWRICEEGTAGVTYNVATGRGTSIEALVRMFSYVAPAVKIETDSGRLQANDMQNVTGDSTRLRQLGWEPRVAVHQSVRDTLEHAARR
jgi:GDP-4-dehydro-6-deoxy-D-mannose reductase